MPRKPNPPKPMVTTILITKARINLAALVKRVPLNKEYFILEKDGIPNSRLQLRTPKAKGAAEEPS